MQTQPIQESLLEEARPMIAAGLLVVHRDANLGDVVPAQHFDDGLPANDLRLARGWKEPQT